MGLPAGGPRKGFTAKHGATPRGKKDAQISILFLTPGPILKNAPAFDEKRNIKINVLGFGVIIQFAIELLDLAQKPEDFLISFKFF